MKTAITIIAIILAVFVTITIALILIVRFNKKLFNRYKLWNLLNRGWIYLRDEDVAIKGELRMTLQEAWEYESRQDV